MARTDDAETVRVTWEDLARVQAAEGAALSPAAAGSAAPANTAAPTLAAAPGLGAPQSYGNIHAEPAEPSAAGGERGSLLLKAWFYLGAAGLLGALIGWAICEPAFVDGGQGRGWGNVWMMPMLLMFLCAGLGVAESVVERSARKALIRAALALPLGIVLGFIFDFFANLFYNLGLALIAEAGVRGTRHPAWWIVRGIGWMVFGAAGGVVYGIIGRSSRKTLYGVLGGVLGAGIGGVVFDPIGMLVHGGALSRAVGFMLFGAATGVGVGIVESALKDRWLYVCGGPLAGKQFILYKPLTVMGREQGCDIYLFKDSTIQPQHAVLEVRGPRVQVRALAPVYVGGQPVQTRVLQAGDLIQIGRYAFRYQERQRAR
jgi:hypothetical protein